MQVERTGHQFPGDRHHLETRTEAKALADQRRWQPQLAQGHVHEFLQDLRRQHGGVRATVLPDQRDRAPLLCRFIGRVGVHQKVRVKQATHGGWPPHDRTSSPEASRAC